MTFRALSLGILFGGLLLTGIDGFLGATAGPAAEPAATPDTVQAACPTAQGDVRALDGTPFPKCK